MKTQYTILAVVMAVLLVMPAMLLAASGKGEAGDPARIEQRHAEKAMERFDRGGRGNRSDVPERIGGFLEKKVDRLDDGLTKTDEFIDDKLRASTPVEPAESVEERSEATLPVSAQIDEEGRVIVPIDRFDPFVFDPGLDPLVTNIGAVLLEQELGVDVFENRSAPLETVR